jgi:chromosome segregation ATPase
MKAGQEKYLGLTNLFNKKNVFFQPQVNSRREVGSDLLNFVCSKLETCKIEISADFKLLSIADIKADSAKAAKQLRQENKQLLERITALQREQQQEREKQRQQLEQQRKESEEAQKQQQQQHQTQIQQLQAQNKQNEAAIADQHQQQIQQLQNQLNAAQQQASSCDDNNGFCTLL